MTQWMSQDNYIYSGDMQQGDREAIDTEIIEWQTMQPPDLNAGITILSNSTPSLNATYAINSKEIAAEVLYMQVAAVQGTEPFTNGQATREWPDLNGSLHTFTALQFLSFAQAAARYVDAILTETVVAQDGGTPNWPTQTVLIP